MALTRGSILWWLVVIAVAVAVFFIARWLIVLVVAEVFTYDLPAAVAGAIAFLIAIGAVFGFYTRSPVA